MAAATLTCSHFPQNKLEFASSKDTSHFIPLSFRIYEKPRRSSSPRMTINRSFNAQIGKTAENSRSSRYNNGKLYMKLDSCLVMPPAKGKKPKALIKFIGGAFIGAVPEVTYSNGALLQVLVGSYFYEKIPKANAIISHNNRPASEAVPYFEQLGPLVNQMMPVIEISHMYSMAQSASDVWKTLIDMAERVVPDYDPEATVSLAKFVDQLPSVFNQVAQGISEFKPAPAENLDCFKKLYNIQHTLLVKFDSDTIDEADLLEETLKPRVESFGGRLEKVVLRGNHITPCVQEPRWQVGPVYTPADAIAQGLKAIFLNDTRVLSRTISNWFGSLDS